MGRFFVIALLCSALSGAEAADLVPVLSRPVSRTMDLPGEFQPFLSVALHAKVTGYVERVLVDRGSAVKEGELVVELSAPELRAAITEAEFKLQSAEADRLQAEAQLSAAQSTYVRLKKAAETPGAVAGNELVQAQEQVNAAQALVRSRQQASRAAAAMVQSKKETEAYLRITAPFDGMVTERLVHPGALVGPGSDSPLLIVQQLAHLRLVVPVPEEYVGGVVRGAGVPFRVPAFPDRTFYGTIARSAHALDQKTRTMAVEMDVINRDGSLAPGMFPTVKWPMRSARAALWVPKTSVVTTTERTFVVRDRNGRAEWVDVKTGVAEGDLIEVIGSLRAGDLVLHRGSDEVRQGQSIR